MYQFHTSALEQRHDDLSLIEHQSRLRFNFQCDFICSIQSFGCLHGGTSSHYPGFQGLFTSAFGRRRVGLWPTKLLVAREKKPLVPRVSSHRLPPLALIQWEQRLVKFNHSLQRPFVISRSNLGEECRPLYRGLEILYISVLRFNRSRKCHNGTNHSGASSPGCCTGARILLPREISQQYHANEDLLTVRPFSIFGKVRFVAVAFLYL